MEIIWIAAALCCGFSVKRAGLPPLIGYLLAGFGLVWAQQQQWVPVTDTATLNHLAHAGVLLLLFSVGLKINLRQLLRMDVAGTSVLHTVGVLLVFTPVLVGAFALTWGAAALLAATLSFSSTVLAAKSLEAKKELRAFHGQVAIGILIVQDLFAMGLLSLSSGQLPSVAALGLLGLPILRPLIGLVLDRCGHDDLLLLFGLCAAFAGGALFQSVGMSAELGALVAGVLCASHEKSTEIVAKIWAVKELLLVAFFLSIGLQGLPNPQDLFFAGVMLALLPIQAVLFFVALVRFKLSVRSAFLAAIALSTYSEFGLIVAAVAMPQWTVSIALAVALSFLLAAPLNKFAHQLFDACEPWLKQWEMAGRPKDEEPVTLGAARLLILGMGRVGRAAFRAARGAYAPGEILGWDTDQEKVNTLQMQGYSVQYADAEHTRFWTTISTHGLDAVIVAMDCPESSEHAIRSLRSAGFAGVIVAHSQYPDDAHRLEMAGAEHSYVTMDEAGKGLFAVVEHTLRMFNETPREERAVARTA